MDFFTYKTKEAYINSLTKIKDLEEELRNLNNPVTDNIRTTSSKSFDQMVNPFKLFTQCFKKFEENSKKQLPDFLYRSRYQSATVLLGYLLNQETQITYEQYIDIFKDLNTELILPWSNSDSGLGLTAGVNYLTKLTDIVKDNTNPYKLSYQKLRANQIYDLTQHPSSNSALLLQALALRQVKFNDLRYTLLEDFIVYLKQRLNTNNINPNATLDTTQLLNACIEFEQIIKDMK